MSQQVLNKETGEIKTVITSWRKPKASSDYAYTQERNIIQLQDFSFNPESRELEVVDTSKEDRDAYIQSFKDDCGVYNILAKYSLTGDSSLLNRGGAFYADISGMPTDELNPEAASALAAQQLKALNDKYGLSLTDKELASMTPELLEKLISDTVAKLTRSESPDEPKKEGE